MIIKVKRLVFCENFKEYVDIHVMHLVTDACELSHLSRLKITKGQNSSLFGMVYMN